MNERIKDKKEKNIKISNREKNEIVNQLKLEIKSELLKWIKKSGMKISIVFTILAIFGFQVSLLSIYNKVKDSSSVFITKLINEQFSKPNVESTLKNVAGKEAKTLIREHVQPEIDKVKEEVNSFELYLNDYQKKYDVELTKITQEVYLISKRNEIIKIGDRAINSGDRDAFNQLTELLNSEKNDYKEIIRAELFRVKKFYISINRFLNVDLSYEDTEGNIIKNEQAPTNMLIECLLNNNKWKMRARAAFCLRTKKEKEVINALAESIKNDKNLDVLKESICSFEMLSGYTNPDVLDGRSAIQWWEENRDEFQFNSN